MRIGKKKVPIHIVNLTNSHDIFQMLNNSKYDKRVTINLDEVMFRHVKDEDVEKGLGFPFKKVYKEHLLKGLPAVCNHLANDGYDIWVYTTGLYSREYIHRLLKFYHIDTNFIVTGATRFDTTDSKEKKQLAELFAKKYDVTIHIYGEALLYVKRSAKKSLHYELHKDSWSGDAIEILDEIHKKEIAAI